MLRRFQFPLGLILSYATYSALLWETDHSIHAIRSLLANNDFIVFLQALLSKSGGSALAQTTTVAVALVNVEMVLHALAVGFFFAWALLVLIEGFIYAIRVLITELPPIVSRGFFHIAELRDIEVNKKSATFFAVAVTLILTLWIFSAVLNIIHLLGNPYNGAYSSWGAQLLRYAGFIEDFISIIANRL